MVAHRLRIIPRRRGTIIAPPFAVGAPDISQPMGIDEATIGPSLETSSTSVGTIIEAEPSFAHAVIQPGEEFISAGYPLLNAIPGLRIFVIATDHTADYEAPNPTYISAGQAEGLYFVSDDFHCGGLERTHVRVSGPVPLVFPDIMSPWPFLLLPFWLRAPGFTLGELMYAFTWGSLAMTAEVVFL